jgi:hypothetical protein
VVLQDVFDFLVGILCPGQRPQYLIDAEIAAKNAPVSTEAPPAYAGLIAGLAAAAAASKEEPSDTAAGGSDV